MHPIFIEYLAICEVDASPSTLRNYRQAFKVFDAWLDANEIDLAAITQPQVQRFIIEQDHMKANSLQTYIGAIRAAFLYAKDVTESITRSSNPFIRLRYKREVVTLPKIYSNEQIKRFYEEIETDREWLAFHLFAYAGMRRQEVCNLKWEHIDFTGRLIDVVGKGNKLRQIPLHPKLAAALVPSRRDAGHVLTTLSNGGMVDKPAGTQISVTTLHRSMSRWFVRAGVNDAQNHTFRRTMASVLTEKGVSDAVRDKIMGWAPKGVPARHYIRFADSTLYEAICKVNYGEGTTRRQKRHLHVVRHAA